MATLKLYGLPPSAPFRAVEALCKLANIPYEYQQVNVPQGEQRKPEFLAVNPLGQIPAIVDGDFHLGESHAILTYLHSAYHASDSLYPADLRKRAKVDQYLHWHHANTRKASWVVFGVVIAPRVGRVLPATFVADNTETTKKALVVIEQWLTASPYIAGDELTIADLSAFQEVYQLSAISFDLSEFPHVQAWSQRLLELPAIRETVGPFDAMMSSMKAEAEQKTKEQSA